MGNALFSQRFAAVTGIASVVALVVAAYQIYQSMQQTKHARALAASLSTQFCGDFPAYLSRVAEVIAGAQYSLKIMAVAPSHGGYSDEVAWLRIKQAIESKLSGKFEALKTHVFTAVLVYSSASCFLEAFRLHHSGLTDPAEWEIWKQEEIENGHLSRFIRNRPEAANLSGLDLDAYLTIRLEEDRNAIKQVYSDFTQMESNELLPMFCWIADDNKAVFSIRTEDKRGHYNGVGIFTADQGLISMLAKSFEYYKDHPATTCVKNPL
jgi:hypothetical protein